MKTLCHKHGIKEKLIDASCYTVLSDYHWPGNVRELINAIERMLIMGGTKLIKADIPAEIRSAKKSTDSTTDSLTLKEYLHRKEREFIILKLQQCRGNISQTASELDIDRSYLHKKLVTHNIKREQQFE